MDLEALGGLLERLATAVERLADTTDQLLAQAERNTAASETVTASILRNERRMNTYKPPTLATESPYIPPVDPLKGRW